jgi:hypothetical protein
MAVLPTNSLLIDLTFAVEVFRNLCGSYLGAPLVTGEIIAQREAEQNQQPDESSGCCEMQKPTASFDVHKEERHQQSF